MKAEMVRLADCATLTKGKPPAEMPYYGEDAELYLSPEYLRGNGIAEPAKPAVNAVRVRDSDTILLWDGSNAGEFFRARAGMLASTMTRIGHDKEFEPEYFFYATKRWEAYLKGQTSGSGIPHVDKEVFGRLGILKLPPEEQKLVAHILSQIDRSIEQTESLIAKRQRIKTGLMQDFLTKGIDEHGKIRSEATHAFTDSPLGRIPVGWEVESFQDACLRVSVGIATSTTKYFRDDGVPLLRNQNVLAGKFDLSDLLYIAPEFDALNKSKRLRPGDLVTMRTGYPGRTAVVTKEMQGWQTFTTLISTPRRKKYLPDYLSMQLNSFVGRMQIMTLQGGGAQQNLNVGWIVNLKVLRPSMHEQELVIDRIKAIEQAFDVHAAEHSKLLSLKAGLMHDLLTGARRVSPLLAQAVHG